MNIRLRDLKVVLLCGGQGTRLRPLTNNLPKPLIPINGKPILDYLISHFKRHGAGNFIVAGGHQAGRIKEHLEKNYKGDEIEIVDSGDVDIIQRLRDCARRIAGDFIFAYGDTLADVDMSELLAFHARHAPGLTITVHPLKSQFGLFDLDAAGKARSFREKPVLDQWLNIGYCYFPASFIPDLGRYSGFAEFLEALSRQGKIYGFRHRGVHITVNTLTELQEAEKNIQHFEASLAEPLSAEK